MDRFAARTGLTQPAAAPRRYLWTDAYAVCNFLELAQLHGDERHLRLARCLVEQVHETLGRHRPGGTRAGWISGLAEADGKLHPTIGGLRIGKPLPERRAGERFDEHAEWDRDGQYFHYLTRWMHALALLARATGDARGLQWAVELALTARQRFAFERAGRRFLHWKMSVDLTRSLSPSVGQHDAIDGLVALLELRARAQALPGATFLPVLDEAIADLRSIWGEADCATEDALGIGGLLAGAAVLARLLRQGHAAEGHLLVALLRGAADGLRASGMERTLTLPASRRLAFRELGLAIGLQAVPGLQALGVPEPSPRSGAAEVGPLLQSLAAHRGLEDRIVDFWLDPTNQAAATWRDHLDIDEVMLASALLPEGVLATALAGN
ncbi:MAG: hypothetical protein FJ265_16380 [Planctomycetes bacterium]|nr:hypothetical protein [Planctomycetota bacterium]